MVTIMAGPRIYLENITGIIKKKKKLLSVSLAVKLGCVDSTVHWLNNNTRKFVTGHLNNLHQVCSISKYWKAKIA